jgi:hypothetical protein
MNRIEVHTCRPPRGDAFDDGNTGAAAGRLGHWLYMAATPTFAIMALLTGLDGAPVDKLCSAGLGTPLSGMVPMYLLMAAFHAPPWLKLIFGPRARVGRS